jgi:hypothetical protein
VEQIEVALAPLRSREPEPRNEAEQHHEDDESGPVYILHGVPPQALLFVADRLAM